MVLTCELSMPTLFNETVVNCILVAIASFIIGLSKAGVKGVDMMNVTIMAIVFGSKTSTGVVLPLLCVGDVLAVIYYHRHAQWIHFRKLMPWMIVGVLLGVYAGKDLDEEIFRKLMAIIIMLTVVAMLILEMHKTVLLPLNKFFSVTMGLVSGFTTMIGNLAGAFSNIYFLATGLSKNDFIGTAAWIFLVVNYFKLPFQIFFWKNINLSSLRIDLYVLPPLLIGFWAGVKLVAAVKDNSYRKGVIILTLLGAVFIFFGGK